MYLNFTLIAVKFPIADYPLNHLSSTKNSLKVPCRLPHE